jgi:hypothetical protein
MSDVERRFHETWLGMVQPIDGLVVSIPVLVDAQCMERQPPHVQQKLLELCPATKEGEAGPEGYQIGQLSRFLAELLGLTPELFDVGEALPDALSLYVPEGRQTLRPTLALKKQGKVLEPAGADATPASVVGARYELLVWEIPRGLELDKPETVTGTWDYPPSAKFDRLLRHCRVPAGLLVNGDAVRLTYAPHGESSGAITFRLEDMASVGGRPILDAFVMLLSANRFFGVAPERTLPALLAESRKRQANVTNDLADQVFEALQILLRGFESAAERDERDLLDDALAREGDHLYRALLTVLLRLVFVLYAEDRGLLPVNQPIYAKHLSVLGLFEELQADRGAYPDSMSRRFGAWGRLVTLFRAIYLGVSHGDFTMPPRRGSLFNPHEYPFLEGWGPAGSAPISEPEDRAAVRLPTVDDETVFRVLERLLVFEGQRLSYRALDVEQIGSVYEALMGYHVLRVPAEAVCVKPDRIWVSPEEVLAMPAARRPKWLKETLGLSAAQSEKLSEELKAAEGKQANQAALEALGKYAAGGKKGDPSLSKARAGQLVLQPGTERRRTSSHYTPRSLSEPIVRRTLEPLLAVMGDAPASERILNLKVCDPAMGSGAFLVEACRFLADHVLAAWTREQKIETIAAEHGDPLLHARRIVAQRCLYGVDKNDAAVELAKLSLWLVTLAKNLPFTFLDHSLRHGDSLVGLDFDQIRAFHWKRPEKEPPKQLELFGREIVVALEEAIGLRQKIGELGDSPLDDREKARLFWDAQDALNRVRLIGDLVVGAFFAHEKDKDREAERVRRENLVRAWLSSGEAPPEELLAMQREIRVRLPVFHWMVEFPEVFYAERPDPLDRNQVNRAAYMDAFLGNPPFVDKNALSALFGEVYIRWLLAEHEGAHGNADLSAHFFRRTGHLIGEHGTIGLIATNTIAQGDTRATGLQWLLGSGFRIYYAASSFKWPGLANVSVAVIHLVKGRPAEARVSVELDEKIVSAINSRLRIGMERTDAVALDANRPLWFQGAKVYGSGFQLDPREYQDLLRRDQRINAVIRPYLGGEELNSSARYDHERYVINFGQQPLEAVSREWPELLRLVEERVRPEREQARADTADGAHRKKYWWQFAQPRPELFEAIRPLQRCLVSSRVTKHLTFAFQGTDRVFSEQTNVFVFESPSAFATLQSRIHEHWARLLSSSMRNDLRYSASDCFETFPFPKPDPRTVIPSLEDIGQRLYDFRAKYMVDENVGLTISYNRLKDPTCDDARILELRRLHEEMDRQVLAAYAEGDPEGRWLDVEVPPFCALNEDDKKRLEKFEDAVIDRLFVLNAKRAEEEKLKGLGGTAPKKRGKQVANELAGGVKTRNPRSRKAAPEEQLQLGQLEPDEKP